jgi:hypothetical protein
VTFSYSGNPNASPTDAVRFYTGDKDPGDPLLQDEEIAFALTQYGDVFYAASAACDAIAAVFARKVHKRVGTLDLDAQQQYEHYCDLAKELRARAVTSGLTVFAGGVFVTDHDTTEGDASLRKPFFRRDMDEDEGAGGTSQSGDLLNIER